MNLAPIVLFVYNRPWHTRQTVEALRKNDLAIESNLIIYSDGPKNELVEQSVNEVRHYIKSIHGFKSIEIIERDQNLGLANSIISGVTEVINKFKKVIVLEDDLISSTQFLLFINQALAQYKDENKILSVSGYSYPINIPINYKYDGYCSYRSMSWSWGTWQNRWQKADWEVKDFNDFVDNKERQKTFNRGGDDLSDLLISQVERGINSWSIIWDYTHFKYNAYCFCPVKSKIFNIGFDGTGVHGFNRSMIQSELDDEIIDKYNFSKDVIVENYFVNKIRILHKYTIKRKLKRLLLNYLQGRK